MEECKDHNIVITKKLKGGNDDKNGVITLVANTGVQFLDFELDQPINKDDDDPNIFPKYISVGKFQKIDKLGHFARYNYNEIDNNLEIRADDEVYQQDLNWSGITTGENANVNMLDSLKLYNGVWFPIPYFVKDQENGPRNWVRARIINLSNNPSSFEEDDNLRFHLTLAFDTTVEDNLDEIHGAPTPYEIDNSFTFRSGYEASKLLEDVENSESFVRSWAESVFEFVYDFANSSSNLKKDKCKKIIKESKENLLYEKHYLNLLAFIERYFEPNEIKIIPFDKNHSSCDSSIDVSLILDVGNSRTTGLIVEEDKTSTQNSDTFLVTEELQIRDFNAPEKVYVGAFDSKIEFAKANFDFESSSAKDKRQNAFSWPSLVRVGNEATRLASLKKGNTGNTGINSPKRYLWQITTDSKAPIWHFNSASYQVPVYRQDEDDNDVISFFKKFDNRENPAIYPPITDFLNSEGEALFTKIGNPFNMEPRYSCKSTMTFMLVEIILQALMQMNSYAYRSKVGNIDLPRRLNSLVLTTPPSMPELEREIFRSCAYQAIGIIWKSYKYDQSEKTTFNFLTDENIYPKVPNIVLKWDETLAGQMVYLYNETQMVHNGNCKEFIKEIRRADADNRLNEHSKTKLGRDKVTAASSRIETIDIGGGTTDLIIADYSFPDKWVKDDREIGNQSSVVTIREVLRDGFKIAGDDLVLDIIKKYILPQIADNEVLSTVVGRTSMQDVKNRKNRVQAVEQVFVKIAHRIIDRLENLEILPRGECDVKDSGTIKDFLTLNDKCETIDNKLKEMGKDTKPQSLKLDIEVLKYLNNNLSRVLKPNFNILNVNLSFDIYKINREIALGYDFDISKCLNYLNAIVNTYRCDVLLLNGRPTKLPGIRELIQSRSFLSPYRIISMHSYKCGSWYPCFKGISGKIGDTKSTVAVGALLCYTKMSDASKLVNFRIDTNVFGSVPPIRYLGVIDTDYKIKDEEILYRYQTKSEEDAVKLKALQENNLDEYAYDENQSGQKEIDDLFFKPDANFLKPVKYLNPSLGITDDDNSNSDSDTLDANSNKKQGVQSRYFERDLAINIGFRQFNDEAFTSTMLYAIEPFKDIRELTNIYRDFNDLSIPDDVIFYSDEGKEVLNRLKSTIFQICDDRKDKDEFTKLCDDFFNDVQNQGSTNYQGLDEEFKQNAQNYATEAMNNLKVGWFGAQKKKEAEYERAYNEYVSNNLASLNSQKENLRTRAYSDLNDMFTAKLSSKIMGIISKLKQGEDTKLKDFQEDVNLHHRFKIKLETAKIDDDGDIKLDPVYKTVKFIKEEEDKVYTEDRPYVYQSNLKNVVFFKISEAVNLNNGDDAKKYLSLRLKTVNGDDEYWNNTGLIIKD